ncbi:Cobalt-precorrin-7 (C5)-methyltransferase / Cobalt-precorrin-6B C15-methyltransferase [decarboxylating] [hydrothermal vent metagenome]|uniref:Cobalt-precorrin-7 (C5)-methyltransferase / Cobalt-precorrin-6B C15-methyltransferase [decarboxylating] n=1 Tax=hydrothermal vent metagenome TaxID=652676 RepID=A0A3B0YZB9_9ZZZZ
MTKPTYIIGVLDNGVAGLSAVALQQLHQADVIIGACRTLLLFKNEFKKTTRQYDIAEGLSKVPVWITQAQNDNLNIVVLATGDPMCHGIGRYLMNKLEEKSCKVIPNVSTLQLAFARLGLAWQDAEICSVHSKDAGEWTGDAGAEHGLYPVLEAVRCHHLIAIFTSPENSPQRIARMLINVGLGETFNMSVAEALLSDQENVIRNLSLHKAAKHNFVNPNIVILQRQIESPITLFGLADESFVQRKPDKGLITKREVRAVSLARLQLRIDSIVWDIGAGSGAVGLEAARLCSKGYVYAIEKNEADVVIARTNCKQMVVTNYRVQHGKAPDLLSDWADPDAVFFGGSGGELAELIKLCLSRLKENGWLVMNFVTLENLALATAVLQELKIEWDVTQLQASRSQPILHMHRMKAENPVWIVCAQQNRNNECNYSACLDFASD